MREQPAEHDHVFGPVPSRRLGRSLGVDLVPHKTCSYDCVYCQLGRTLTLTRARKPYVPAQTVIGELDRWLGSGESADAITLSGSGEPMLNSEIGEVIRWLKERTPVPIALLTNGSLLADSTARAEVLGVDLLLPSLDAASPSTFERINRPHPEVELEQVIEGLAATRRDFGGAIWLEVMLVAGINDTAAELGRIRAAADTIRPDRLHVNTVVRPPADADATPLDEAALEAACQALGSGAESIAGRKSSSRALPPTDLCARICGLLRRRPCTVSDIASALSIDPNEVLKWLGQPPLNDIVTTARRADGLYYVVRGAVVE